MGRDTRVKMERNTALSKSSEAVFQATIGRSRYQDTEVGHSLISRDAKEAM
jgi:hypothetical protein